jgi:hypothetical protein
MALGDVLRGFVDPTGFLLREREAQRHAAVDQATQQAVRADTSCAAQVRLSGEVADALLRTADPVQLRAQLLGSLPARRRPAWLATVPWTGADPAVVASWWAAHSRAEQLVLLTSASSRQALGNLDGIAWADRDAANRATLAEHLARGTATAVDHAVESALAEAARLTDRPVLLTVLDPAAFGGKGRAAVSVGDPGTADRVAYLVPGLDAAVSTSLTGLVADAARISNALHGGRSGDSAVVAWLGYDTPTLLDVAGSGRAWAGAARLSHELAGLRALRGTDQPQLTVVGHSYGSTTAAAALLAAAAEALAVRVDDLVVLGSPGLLADDARAFALRPGHLWVGAASGDPVSHLGWFDGDPAQSSFGARRFPAEVSGKNPRIPQPWQHVHYFDPGSQALSAIVDIVSGDDEQVPPAPGRGYGPVPALLATALGAPLDPTFGDPEAPRPAAPSSR